METTNDKTTLFEYFSELDDPRIERTKLHPLINILTISICAIIANAESWEDIEMFANAKKEWFASFLDLKNGIPSHDTLARVFSRLDPEQLQQSFLNWIKSTAEIIPEDIVAIDGKTLRRSFDKGKGKGAIHMVSAWSNMNHLVLGQVKVSEKSNEITAIPELLDVLALKGCIVTIDAMGCQKAIAQKITDREADYVLALKGNQSKLSDEVCELYEHARQTNFFGMKYDFHETEKYAHGRNEIRRCWMLYGVEKLQERKKWSNLNSIGVIESERTVGDHISRETRYYISSLTSDAKTLSSAIRNHWGIENSVHWILDMAFREDECRIRKDHAPENFSVLRHIALNLLKKDKTKKVGIKAKRKACGWDVNYLRHILAS
jgi:predicted transposase YbfD/YdcC